MKPVLIGSRAIAFWDSTFKVNPNADWDFIGYPDMKPDVEGRIEWHDPKHLNNLGVLENFGTAVKNYRVTSLFTLAAIYRSHLHRPHNWDSHIAKYHKHLEESFYDGQFYQERKRLTYEEYGNRHPKLMQSNEDFFDDNVEKVYDHDYLHELYAYYDRPLFERLKPQGGQDSAWCSKDLWTLLDLEDKIRCVSEECYVIATERFLVPNQWDFSPKRAYYMALRKVCTTLTSGWFRDFAIDHFPEVYNLYDTNKVNQVKGRLT